MVVWCGLRAVADVVAQHAHVAQDQGLSALPVHPIPGPLGRIALTRFLGVQHAPVGEVPHQVLIGVPDRIRQVARVIDVQTGGDERSIVFRLQARQGVNRRPGGVEDEAVVVQVDEVGRVPLAVMRLAAALPAIRLARQLADVSHRVGRAQEGGHVVRQGAHGGDADQTVSGIAPGLNGGGNGDGGQHADGGGGEGETLHGGQVRTVEAQGLNAPRRQVQRSLRHSLTGTPPAP